MRPSSVRPDCDLSVVIRTRDDEECIGSVLLRLHTHLVARGLHFELLIADENSGDNTLAVATLLKAQLPEVRLYQCSAGAGYFHCSNLARGRLLLLCDARSIGPLTGIGFGLGELQRGVDVLAISGRYLMMRRTRALRAFSSLRARTRSPVRIERRFVRKSRALGLTCQVAGSRAEPPALTALRRALLSK